MDSFLIKVKIFDKIKFVKLYKENLSLEKFITAALTVFNMNTDRNAKVTLCDPDGANIEKDQFVDIVLQFINCNHFYIRLGAVSDATENELAQELEYYLRQNKCNSLFIEYNEKNVLEHASIQFLSDILFKFIDEKYSIDNRKDIEMVCSSLEELFPNLKKVSILSIEKCFISLD